MATEFLMPKLGLTMEQGTIVEWLCSDGEMVGDGAAVLRIETDKTETEVESPGSGHLHFVGQVGDTYECGERIGWLLVEGESVPTGTAPSSTPVAAAPAAPAARPVDTAARAAIVTPPGARIIASPLARRLARERNIDLRFVAGTGPGGRIVEADLDELPAVTSTTRDPTGISAPATVAARQLADLLGVDIGAVPVDPTDGRITREGVAFHVRSLISQVASEPAGGRHDEPALPQPLQAPSSTVRLSGVRGTIAKRMHESLTQMAQLTLFMDADLDRVVADRQARSTDGSPPGYTDYVIAATARALVEHPILNSQITDDGVSLLPAVHVGMAVALDGGLIVPVVRDAADLDLAALSNETTRLAEAARTGSLDLTELEGGTFSVSALGMFGVDGFTPVINPPNTAILGVGRLRDDVVVTDGDVATITRLTLSLTWDHRAFDGAPAAQFCQTIVRLLSEPEALDLPASNPV